MIKPTVGRIVWFYEDHYMRELAAIITCVHSDSCVNLAIFNKDGGQFFKTSVFLYQESRGDLMLPSGEHCRWMPYQIGQAKQVQHNGEVPTPPIPFDNKAQPLTAPPPPGFTRWSASVETPVEYTPCFQGALAALKDGKAVARSGWNGKGMFAYMVGAASYPAQTGVAKRHFGESAVVPYNAYFALKGADGTVNTWVPSISDLLAEDWKVVV